MKSKTWLAGWSILVVIVLCIIGKWMYIIDPYIHYHSPNLSKYFYTLNNQRSQNDGITKHFDYDALITGTSMTENFKTSEMDAIFGTTSIKVPFAGGSYKEINDNLIVAIENNPNLKIIVRGLDMQYFFDDKDMMHLELGVYPTYLYDANPFNDVEYLFNRDLIWNRMYPMIIAKDTEDFEPGITSFDDYSKWQFNYTFGINTVCPNGIGEVVKGEAIHLTDEEVETIRGNIEQNVVSLAKDNPNVTFYYFFAPYSIGWWKDLVVSGLIYKQVEAEEYVINMILQCDNIKLYSFNNRIDIITDLNNYKDNGHYGQWVNSLMLRWMHDGEYQLTKDNYKEYLREEWENYINFDYDSLNSQTDYENDFYVAALFNRELTGAEPIKISDMEDDILHLNNANIVENQWEGRRGIECIGSLLREPGSEISVEEYLNAKQYIGAEIEISDVDDYGYLVFYGKKITDHGQPTVCIFNEQGEIVGEVVANYFDLDNEWHQYVIDITDVKGDIKIIFNGGYIDSTGSSDSRYIFSDIVLY